MIAGLILLFQQRPVFGLQWFYLAMAIWWAGTVLVFVYQLLPWYMVAPAFNFAYVYLMLWAYKREIEQQRQRMEALRQIHEEMAGVVVELNEQINAL